jgi:signal transduction histidine kinase
VPRSDREAAAFAGEWERGLAGFEALDPASPAVKPHVWGCIGATTSFYRHYLGDDVTALQRRHGALLHRMMAKLDGGDAPRALRSGRRRELERVRLRIAGDLHDELGGNLSGIVLLSRRVRRQETLGERERSELDELARIATQTTQSVRDIVWFINPSCDTLEEMIQRMDKEGAMVKGHLYSPRPTGPAKARSSGKGSTTT